MEVSRTQLNGSVLREKELVVSYKTIYINLFSAIVLDMKTGMIKFRYESYQLWESPVTGFLNSQNDFVVLNREGLSFLPLGNQENRAFCNSDGVNRMVHSLQSCNYLKIEDSNHLLFERPKNGNTNRLIHIQEQYQDYK